MEKIRTTPILLIAEDDEDDRLLFKDAFEETGINGDLHFVENGQQLLDYLHHYGLYTDLESFPSPHIILMDLDMPCKNGQETLQEIKADPLLRRIPVVMLTTSKEEEGVLKSYILGASYIVKPSSFTSLVKMIKNLCAYWCETVLLPESPSFRMFIKKQSDK